jgi:hypothetical protein
MGTTRRDPLRGIDKTSIPAAISPSANVIWGQITGTPTTLAGYGITDAYTKAQVDTLLAAKVTFASGTTGKITKWSAAGTIADSVITESAGKVGFNQPTPGAQFHMTYDSSVIDGFMFDDTQASGRKYRMGSGNAGVGNFGLVDDTAGTLRWYVSSAGHHLFGQDNVYDIGALGATRPRSLYIGTDLYMPTVTANGAGVVTISNLRPAAATVATIAGWLKIMVAGTASYIPYWR